MAGQVTIIPRDSAAHMVASLFIETRRAAGLSQQALAERMGVSRSSLSLVEWGINRPTIGLLDRLAQATGRELVITFREET